MPWLGPAELRPSTRSPGQQSAAASQPGPTSSPGANMAYRLTFDEQQAAKLKVLADSRIRRLQQVRAQDQHLARSRARSYRALCGAAAQQLQQELVALLERQRQEELLDLQQQYAEALEGVATAQRSAAETSAEYAAARAARAEQLARRTADAQRRYAAAISRVRAARDAELAVIAERLQRRQEVFAAERASARAAAARAREEAAAAAAAAAEMDLAEQERRRRQLHSRVDFRYSRLHQLGVPALVVREEEEPGDMRPRDPAIAAAEVQERCVVAWGR